MPNEVYDRVAAGPAAVVVGDDRGPSYGQRR